MELRKAFPKIFELSADELILTESSKLRVGQKSRIFEKIEDSDAVSNLKGYFLTNNTVVLTFDAYWGGSVRYRCDSEYEFLVQQIKGRGIGTQASDSYEELVSDLEKLDEERKAKEAEARRLAKLKEERKAKEALKRNAWPS